MSDNDVCEELLAEVRELRDDVKRLEDENELLRSEVDALKQTRDTAYDEREDLQRDINRLEGTVRTIGSVGENEVSTKTARVNATRAVLIRRALQKSGFGEGKAQMTYRDVLGALSDLGHGDFAPSVAYDILDEMVETDGFADAENGDGTRVVRVDTDDLPPGVIGTFSAANNANTVSGPSTRLKTER